MYYLLTKKANINISDCYLIEADGRFHFVTKRFLWRTTPTYDLILAKRSKNFKVNLLLL